MTTSFPTLTVINGVPSVSSLDIAEHFQKRHDHVLRKIRQIISECQPEFTAPNFGVSEYVDDTGRSLPMFNLTRDGFTLLAMGFAGKVALTWKVRYIEAFNAMEQAILAAAAKPLPPAIPAPATYDASLEGKVRELRGLTLQIKEVTLEIYNLADGSMKGVMRPSRLGNPEYSLALSARACMNALHYSLDYMVDGVLENARIMSRAATLNGK